MSPNSHRTLCLLVARWLLKQRTIDYVAWEIAWNTGFVDAIGFSSPDSKHPRVACIEVKKSRTDLLADINSSKYLKYEYGASHCYLAGTLAAFGIKNQKDFPQALKDLENRGFPKHWGILILPRIGFARPKLMRAARSMKRPNPNELTKLAFKALRALASKGLRRVDLD